MSGRALVVAVALIAAAPGAAAAGAIEVTTSDSHVSIVVRGVEASGAVEAGADRLDIPLRDDEVAREHVRLGDALVRKVELGGDPSRLRVKLRTKGRRVRALAGATIVRATADGVEILIPRDPSAATAATTLAAPAAPAPSAAPSAGVTPASAPVAAPSPAISAEPPAPPARAPSSPQGARGGAGGLGVPWGSLALIGAAAAVAAFVLRRRARAGKGADTTLSVRTSMSLGPRARLVVVGAGERELLVSVDGRGVRLLDTWERHDDGRGGPTLAPAIARPSPSVSGIVRLRGVAGGLEPRGSSPRDAVADPEAPAGDDDWARDLTAALRARGGLS